MAPPQPEGLVGDSLTYSLPEGLFFDPDGRITTLTLTGPLPTGVTRSGLTLRGIPTQSGSFSLTATATDDRGGTISSPVILTISGLTAPSTTIVLAGSTTVCSGSSGLLSATDCTGILTWSNGSTGANILVTPVITTTYSATCSSAGQTIAAANTVTITVTPQPASPLITSTTICSGGSATLSAINCTGSLVWNTGTVSASLVVSPVTTTVYSATCQAGACSSEPGNGTVVVDAQPTASITGNLTSCSGQSTTLTASGGSIYRWNTGATTTVIEASTEGTYSVTVSNGTGCSAITSSNVSMFTPTSPNIAASSTAITVGQSVTLTASGCNGTVNWSTGSSGTRLVVSPSVSTTYSANCRLDSCSSASLPVLITVNHAPIVQTALSHQTVVASQSYSYTIDPTTFSDPDGQALTIMVSGLPPGLSFNGSTRVISGVPTTAGSTTITVTATDAGNLSVSTAFVLTVNPASFAITGVTLVNCQTLSAGQRSITFSPQYVGLTGQPVSFSVVNEMAPTTNSGPYTLNLYTDNASITLQAVQNGVSSSYVYNWLAACNGTLAPNQAPTVANTIPSQSGAVGQSFSFGIPDNIFADDDNVNNLTLSVSGLPSGLTFTSGTGNISGVPTTAGSTTITVTATDAGNLSISTPFVLTINTSSASFAITGVTLVNCQTLSVGQRSISFTPQYVGLNGQPVSFSVVNEMTPTTNSGPYTLNLYTDNASITLQAVQSGITSSFVYNWRSACP
ncbi:hypothetical protein GJR95_28960 [Spirosoma endbachense]|uniref:Dystroglycan-type cadherin-like domain-containing protein n=2 Tax=Spirosoma endbachense TaxID=2666025 RepID=A0A6P1WAA9_9BACT|nr:hypothetical protein GJR95_28960 [Spirosoma endbachense]